MVNGLQELDRSFHKQKIGENGMEIQEGWRQQLKINHVQKELVDKISWELIMNELQVWRENDRVVFWGNLCTGIAPTRPSDFKNL